MNSAAFWPQTEVAVRTLQPLEVVPGVNEHFFSPFLAAQLGRRDERHDMTHEVWLLPDAFPDAASETIGLLTLKPKGIPRKSENHVHFGRLDVPGGINGGGVDIAIKPSGSYAAAREFGALSAVGGLAATAENGRSLQPVGFYFQPFADVALLTREEDLRDMGQLEVCGLDDAEAYEALRICGRALGSLHALGVAHGDAIPRNMAVNGDDELRYLDLEEAYDLTYRKDGVQNTSLLSRLVADDVKRMAEYADHYTYLFPEGFMPEYQKALATANSRLPEEAHLTNDQIVRAAA